MYSKSFRSESELKKYLQTYEIVWEKEPTIINVQMSHSISTAVGKDFRNYEYKVEDQSTLILLIIAGNEFPTEKDAKNDSRFKKFYLVDKNSIGRIIQHIYALNQDKANIEFNLINYHEREYELLFSEEEYNEAIAKRNKEKESSIK